MQSSLRYLFHLRSLSLPRHILAYTQTVKIPIYRSSPPRASFNFSTGINPRFTSFDKSDEEEEGTSRERSVSTYYDPVQDRVVTIDRRMDELCGSISQAGTSNREIEGEEEGKKLGPTIWERSSKQNVKEEKTGSSKIYSDTSRKKGKNSKVKIAYGCDNCGSEFSQWWGRCPKCGVGSVSEREHDMLKVNPKRGAEVSEAAVRTWLRQKPGSMIPKTLADVNMGREQSDWRIQL